VAPGRRGHLARYLAPAAFLVAVTVAVLLVRSALHTGSSAGPSVTTTASTTASTTRHVRPRFYRLRAGETISDVALRFDTTVERLLALNPRIKPTQLRVGQRIRVR
jgi:peptidoglycan endopeptidase LytE